MPTTDKPKGLSGQLRELLERDPGMLFIDAARSIMHTRISVHGRGKTKPAHNERKAKQLRKAQRRSRRINGRYGKGRWRR